MRASGPTKDLEGSRYPCRAAIYGGRTYVPQSFKLCVGAGALTGPFTYHVGRDSCSLRRCGRRTPIIQCRTSHRRNGGQGMDQCGCASAPTVTAHPANPSQALFLWDPNPFLFEPAKRNGFGRSPSETPADVLLSPSRKTVPSSDPAEPGHLPPRGKVWEPLPFDVVTGTYLTGLDPHRGSYYVRKTFRASIKQVSTIRKPKLKAENSPT